MQKKSTIMNVQIINNLYEFWTQIGLLTNRFTKTEQCSAVSVLDSDWPNRFFDFENTPELIEKILSLVQNGKLPDIITTTKPNILKDNSSFEFVFGQKNMALNLKSIKMPLIENKAIKPIKTKKDAINFAKTAS